MGEVPLYPMGLVPSLGFERRGSLGKLVGDHRDAPLQSRLGLLRDEGLGCVVCRGTSLIRNRTPPRTAIGPYTHAYCRVLGGGVFL